MHLTFKKSWRGYVEGRTYDVPDGAAAIYLRRQIAEPSKTPPDVLLNTESDVRKRAAKPKPKPKSQPKGKRS